MVEFAVLGFLAVVVVVAGLALRAYFGGQTVGWVKGTLAEDRGISSRVMVKRSGDETLPVSLQVRVPGSLGAHEFTVSEAQKVAARLDELAAWMRSEEEEREELLPRSFKGLSLSGFSSPNGRRHAVIGYVTHHSEDGEHAVRVLLDSAKVLRLAELVRAASNPGTNR